MHSYNRNGLCSLGFMDDHYPVRSAFSLLNQVKRLFFVACCINNLWILDVWLMSQTYEVMWCVKGIWFCQLSCMVLNWADGVALGSCQ